MMNGHENSEEFPYESEDLAIYMLDYIKNQPNYDTESTKTDDEDNEQVDEQIDIT